jgi:hypothetical protein
VPARKQAATSPPEVSGAARNSVVVRSGRHRPAPDPTPRAPVGRISAQPLEDPMDAITLLKADHDKVKKLLAELESTTERGVKTREQLYTTIRKELTAHEIIEEEIFYPALKNHPRAVDIVLEGYEEHHVVDLLLGELDATPYDDEQWGPKAQVMQENVEHHIEEEEGDMFVKARQVFDRSELEDLGEQMAARKKDALGDPGEIEAEREERAEPDR